eukprot:1063816-Rhodomonas_salina.1
MGCENIKLSKAPRRHTTTDVISQVRLHLRCWPSALTFPSGLKILEQYNTCKSTSGTGKVEM